MFDETQQEYIRQQQKMHAQEEAMRQVHQKQADKAMDVRIVIIIENCDILLFYRKNNGNVLLQWRASHLQP